MADTKRVNLDDFIRVTTTLFVNRKCIKRIRINKKPTIENVARLYYDDRLGGTSVSLSLKEYNNVLCQLGVGVLKIIPWEQDDIYKKPTNKMV